ncbi:MAG: DUF4031 domain-containing protein [Candidatus Zixiibacteriota bacterium]
MSTYVSQPKTSGNKTYAHLTGDSAAEVIRMAERLRVPVPPKQHGDIHLDLTLHKRDLALRYGAQEANDD